MYHKTNQKVVKDQDPEVVAWCRECGQGLDVPLLHIFPQPTDNIKKIRFFAVKDYEKALFYNKGELLGEVAGGVYELDKQARIKGTEIIWFDTALHEIPWGFPEDNGIPTKDGFMVGLFGDIKLRLANVRTFYHDVVGGGKEWTLQDLKNWIRNLLQTSLRDIFKNYNIGQILREDRERVILLVTGKITEEFHRYGLDMESFNVVGIKSPDSAKTTLDQVKDKSVAKAQASKDEINMTAALQKNLLSRLTELKGKLHALQDQLLADQISSEEFQQKKTQIETFINETEEELKKVKDATP